MFPNPPPPPQPQVYMMGGQQYYLVPQGAQPEPVLPQQSIPNQMLAVSPSQQPANGMGIPMQPPQPANGMGIPMQPPQAQMQPGQNSGLVADLCKIIERQSQEIANLVQTRTAQTNSEPPTPGLQPTPGKGCFQEIAVQDDGGKAEVEYGCQEEVRVSTGAAPGLERTLLRPVPCNP
jgi:hypothetical protein